jgi:hypothetical protein
VPAAPKDDDPWSCSGTVLVLTLAADALLDDGLARCARRRRSLRVDALLDAGKAAHAGWASLVLISGASAAATE